MSVYIYVFLMHFWGVFSAVFFLFLKMSLTASESLAYVASENSTDFSTENITQQLSIEGVTEESLIPSEAFAYTPGPDDILKVDRHK